MKAIYNGARTSVRTIGVDICNFFLVSWVPTAEDMLYSYHGFKGIQDELSCWSLGDDIVLMDEARGVTLCWRSTGMLWSLKTLD